MAHGHKSGGHKAHGGHALHGLGPLGLLVARFPVLLPVIILWLLH